jgi:hypothetical protein
MSYRDVPGIVTAILSVRPDDPSDWVDPEVDFLLESCRITPPDPVNWFECDEIDPFATR